VVSTDYRGYKDEIEAEIQEAFATDRNGIVLKADTIGSLEAISKLLKSIDVKISKKGLGKITKRDVLDAFAMKALDKYSCAILSFNVEVDADAELESSAAGVKIINEKVIYKILDDYKEWLESERNEEKREAERTITFPGMVRVLPNACFRVSHPAVFGVDVIVGRVKPTYLLMDENSRKVGRINEIQSNSVSLQEAKRGESVAISVDEGVFGRSIRENMELYVIVDDESEKLLRTKFSHLLANDESELLDRIAELKKQR
jgi:translation initiation factor 5B